MSAPLVSVCVPVRNAERFLGEALASALAQPLALELLVCDDGSGDGTAAVAASLAARDPRVRVLRHRRPRGVVAARNALLAAARGPYVAWLDADDAYLPGALAAQVDVLERGPGVAVVHAAAEIVEESGRRLPPWRRPFDGDAVEESPAAFGELLLANEFVTSTVVARRSALLAAGGFVSVGPSSSDWDCWLRLALQGAVAYRAAPVARYRQHAASISAATRATGARLRCDARVIRRALHLSPRIARQDMQWSRRARSALAAKALLAAGDLHLRGERRAALRALALAARQRPDLARGLARLARASASGDDYAAFVASNALLDRCAGALVGTRYGDALADRAAPDPDWEATLRRIARTVRTITPPDAILGTVTKWDPTLLRLSGRRGRNFPAAAYPPDDAAAVAHLEEQQAQGLSHLVVPSASLWWLDHYAGLAARLRAPLHADADCLIFDLDAAA
ncbi:MAG: glycosyltransferase family 2 protein [Actinobacteria bacterium]|nr:glycosyltransferase family 2 protein [Actinomycetota bacterium]